MGKQHRRERAEICHTAASKICSPNPSECLNADPLCLCTILPSCPLRHTHSVSPPVAFDRAVLDSLSTASLLAHLSSFILTTFAAMPLSQLTADAFTVVLTFLAPCDLSTCAALDRRTCRTINTPSQRDSYLWRILTARLLQQHSRLPFTPPPPLALSPYMPPPLSHFHVLAFASDWPVGFSTAALVTAPGHMHEIAVEGEWSWDEVQHEHSKLMRAVEDSSEHKSTEAAAAADRDERSQQAEEGAEQSEEAKEEEEQEADEDMEEADEEEEWEEGDEDNEDEDKDEEFDTEDEGGEEGGDEDEDEDEDEEAPEQANNDQAAAQQGNVDTQPQPRPPPPPGAPRYIDLRALYQMLDVLDNLTRNIPPQPQADNDNHQPNDNNDADPNAPMMVRDRREFHRFFGRVFRVQGTEDQVARAAEAFMARRRRAEEERSRRQERKRQDDERRQQMMQRAFVDVGALMDADDDSSRRAQRKQHKALEKQDQRWRDIVEAAIARRPAPTYSSSSDDDEGDSDEEKRPLPFTRRGGEQVATRLRYTNNTHGHDRAVVLDRPFPIRLADHAVPFTVVEVVARERLEAMLREQDREDETLRRQEQHESKRIHTTSTEERSSSKEEKHDDETCRKRKSDRSTEVEEKKQKVDGSLLPGSVLSLTRTRSLSNLSSPYYTLCRLSFIAYFEVAIEEADAEEVNRRELRQKEERENRRKQRQASREQRLAAGEPVDDDEEETEAEQAEHQFSRHPDCVSIGLATSSFPLLGKQPGWDRHSYGFHGDDGAVFHNAGEGSKRFGPSFGVGDVVGCGLDYRDGSVFYTKNGRFLGVQPATQSADGDDSNGLLGQWYGVVGLDSGSVVRVSVAGPWVFDVASYERQTSQRQASSHGGEKSGTSLRLTVAELRRLWRVETRKRRAA